MQQNSDIKYLIGSETILEAMPLLGSDEPFSDKRLDFLNKVSKRLFSYKEARQYPDIVTLAFWMRRANMEQQKTKYVHDNGCVRLGRGVIFHIAPSNVAVNYAYSFVAGFVCGNANIVRLPSKDFPQIDIINRAFLEALNEEAYREFEKYICFVRYERSKDINDRLSALCDVRVIWGGDATIAELRRSPLKPRAGEITFADRYSICVIDTENYAALSDADRERIAEGFFNDTYLTDQNACTSPRLMCWYTQGEKADSSSVDIARRQFWTLLEDKVKSSYGFQPVQYVDKLTELYLAAAKIDGLKKVHAEDNDIVRIETDHIEEKLQDYRGNSGFFYEYVTDDITELKLLCNSKLQTITYVGDSAMLRPLIRSGVSGIDRIVPTGRSMDFDFIWDGYDLVERLTRSVYIS